MLQAGRRRASAVDALRLHALVVDLARCPAPSRPPCCTPGQEFCYLGCGFCCALLLRQVAGLRASYQARASYPGGEPTTGLHRDEPVLLAPYNERRRADPRELLRRERERRRREPLDVQRAPGWGNGRVCRARRKRRRTCHSRPPGWRTGGSRGDAASRRGLIRDPAGRGSPAPQRRRAEMTTPGSGHFAMLRRCPGLNARSSWAGTRCKFRIS